MKAVGRLDKQEGEKEKGPCALLTQPGSEAAHRVAASRLHATPAVLLIELEHVDSDHVPGAGAQDGSGRVPWGRFLQAIGGRWRQGPGRVAAAPVPEQQQQRQQRQQQLGPPTGPRGATRHGEGTAAQDGARGAWARGAPGAEVGAGPAVHPRPPVPRR